MKTEQGLIWNGIDLEQKIPEYLTLDSTGRDNYSRKVNKVEAPRDGDIVLNAFLNSRQIGVNFLLKAADKKKLNQLSDKLKALLQGEAVPFKFGDEMEYTRYGTVVDFNLPSGDSTTPVGSFTIEASDPYKYSGTKVFETTTGGLIIDGLNVSSPVKPDVITLTTTTKGKPIILFDNKYRIEFDIAYPAGQVIVINLKNNTITRSGVNEYQHLTIASNVADLKLVNGMKISSNTVDDLKIQYREKVI